MIQNRRKRRSSYTGIALSHQLRACTERAGLQGMLLARQDGLLVAESPWIEKESETIAAELARMGKDEFTVGTVGGSSVAAKTFRVGDERFVLCAVGSATSSTLDEMYRAMNGVTRILGRTL